MNMAHCYLILRGSVIVIFRIFSPPHPNLNYCIATVHQTLESWPVKLICYCPPIPF